MLLAALTRFAEAELHVELVRPWDWLRERFRAVARWLAYPYGIHSPAVHRAAAATGYSGALRIEGVWFPRGTPARFLLPRLNIPANLSANGFAVRLAGLLAG